MASLRQILENHGPALLLDAASSRIQVGWLSAQEPWIWEASNREAGIGLFQCLERLRHAPREASTCLFCEGPGSILGIRTSAMALRTWSVIYPRPMYSFCSLAVVAHALGRDDVAVIADARRNTWHHFRVGGNLRRLDASELSGELATPENFRNWSALPAGARLTPYDLRQILPRIADRDLFSPTTAPDAFLHEEPAYATWTPQVHRAPERPAGDPRLS